MASVLVSVTALDSQLLTQQTQMVLIGCLAHCDDASAIGCSFYSWYNISAVTKTVSISHGFLKISITHRGVSDKNVRFPCDSSGSQTFRVSAG